MTEVGAAVGVWDGIAVVGVRVVGVCDGTAVEGAAVKVGTAVKVGEAVVGDAEGRLRAPLRVIPGAVCTCVEQEE